MNVMKQGGGKEAMEEMLQTEGKAEKGQEIMKQENTSLAVLLFNFKLY